MILHRRRFLTLSAATLASTLAASRLALAGAPGDNRFVFVFLRGGLDGLHALVPWADRDLRRLRPGLAPGQDGVHDLDGYFGLHAALGQLMPMWRAGELVLVPAAATRYRERSHFDGQNLLETGAGQPFGRRDGWLNRAILGLNDGDRRLGLSLGPAVPLILQGLAPVQTWSDGRLPDLAPDFLLRLGAVYRGDPLFAGALAEARGAPVPTMAGAEALDDRFVIAAQAAGEILAQPRGPRIAVLELDGWDTHQAQGGRLDALFARLAEGLEALRTALGPAWGQSVVMAASEFGRTAAENGSGGTDHGTGGLVLLAGGAVRGGRIAGDWPGLSPAALHEGRDLRALTSSEGLFKAILIGHLGLSPALAEEIVFPGSAALTPAEGLLRG